MARELFTFVYETSADGNKIQCVHYAHLETMADLIFDQKHITKLRQLTGLPVLSYVAFKGYLSDKEAREKAAQNG